MTSKAAKAAWRKQRQARKERERHLAEAVLSQRKDTKIFRQKGGWIPRIGDRLRRNHTPEAQARADRYVQLLEFVEQNIPKLEAVIYVEALWDLTQKDWIRPLEEWKQKGRGARSILRSLVEHLYCKYPVPPFLYSVFGATNDRVIDLFYLIATGGSLFKAVKDGTCPVQLTKKMCFTFMQTPVGSTMVEAFRLAQIKAFGGDRRLAKAILASPLGRSMDYVETEKFYLNLIQWFCAQAMMDPTQVGPIIDWAQEKRREDQNFSMAGRTATSVVKHMRVWHRDLAQQRYKAKYNLPEFFTKSGFVGGNWTTKKKIAGKSYDISWTVKEVLSERELKAEGREMRHCVYSYGHRIASGHTSIWSLRVKDPMEAGERCATIEVCNTTKRIVQARQAANRPMTNAQGRIITAWAAKAGLIESYGRW